MPVAESGSLPGPTRSRGARHDVGPLDKSGRIATLPGPWASGGDCEQQTAHLVAALRQRSVDDVLAYEWIEGELLAESYSWDLWGAAYLINGGCSNDGFDYFRGWLLAQGRATWEAAIRDPDSLADHPQVRTLGQQAVRTDDLWCEAILYVPFDAHEALTGQPLTAEVREVVEVVEGAGAEPADPMGEDWDFDDNQEVRRRYPRLVAAELLRDHARHDHDHRPPA